VTSTVPAPVPGVPRAAPRGTRPVRFHVDAWDPSYGTSVGLDDGLDDSTAQVDLDVERPAAQWAAVAPDPGLELPPAVLFVDGVRRIDARVWIDDLPDDPTTDRADGSRVGGLPAAGSGPGEHFAADPDTTDASGAVCASYAAGVMCCCDHRAHLLAVDARHGLFTVASHAVDILTTAGRYEVCHTTDKPAVPRAVTLSAALQSRLGQVELLTAAKARAELAGHADAAGQDLLVVDGPLRGRSHLPRTIGLIKTHQRRPAEPGVSHGHHLGSPLLVSAAARGSGGCPVGRGRPRRMQRGPNPGCGGAPGGPQPGCPHPLRVRRVQRCPRTPEPLPDRRAGTGATPPPRRSTAAVPSAAHCSSASRPLSLYGMVAALPVRLAWETRASGFASRADWR
jgi:hypothetical protein